MLLPRWMGRKGPENKIQLGVNLDALLMTWKWEKKGCCCSLFTGEMD